MYGQPGPGAILVNEPSGSYGYLDYRKLEPIQLRPAMLARGMASIIRFKGFTTRPIPVTEHSMRVARFAAELAAYGSREVAYLWGLLHDAHEVLTPWGDCPSPWKTDEMRKVEAGIDPLIWEAMRVHRVTPWAIADFGVAVTPEIHEVVKRADMAALYYEAMLWQPGGADWVKPTADVDCLLPLVFPETGEDWLTAVKHAGAGLARVG